MLLSGRGTTSLPSTASTGLERTAPPHPGQPPQACRAAPRVRGPSAKRSRTSVSGDSAGPDARNQPPPTGGRESRRRGEARPGEEGLGRTMAVAIVGSRGPAVSVGHASQHGEPGPRRSPAGASSNQTESYEDSARRGASRPRPPPTAGPAGRPSSGRPRASAQPDAVRGVIRPRRRVWSTSGCSKTGIRRGGLAVDAARR